MDEEPGLRIDLSSVERLAMYIETCYVFDKLCLQGSSRERWEDTKPDLTGCPH